MGAIEKRVQFFLGQGKLYHALAGSDGRNRPAPDKSLNLCAIYGQMIGWGGRPFARKSVGVVLNFRVLRILYF